MLQRRNKIIVLFLDHRYEMESFKLSVPIFLLYDYAMNTIVLLTDFGLLDHCIGVIKELLLLDVRQRS